MKKAPDWNFSDFMHVEESAKKCNVGRIWTRHGFELWVIAASVYRIFTPEIGVSSDSEQALDGSDVTV